MKEDDSMKKVFHLAINQYLAKDAALDHGFVVWKTDNVMKPNPDYFYETLMKDRVKDCDVIFQDYKKHLKGLYFCSGGTYKKNLGLEGKMEKYFSPSIPKDRHGNILSNNEISALALKGYDNLNNPSTIKYYADFTTNYLEGTKLDMNSYYSYLNEGDEISGITQAYDYVGDGTNSISGMHEENDGLVSCNLNLFGIKVWIIINRKNSEKLKKILKEKVKDEMKHCTNFWNHKNIILHPSFLKSHNIKYHVVHQKPGMMIVTGIHCFHQVINVTQTLATARNYATNDWLTIKAENHWRCMCSSLPVFDKSLLRNYVALERKYQLVLEEKGELEKRLEGEKEKGIEQPEISEGEGIGEEREKEADPEFRRRGEKRTKENTIESDLFSLVAVKKNKTLMQLLSDDVLETEKEGEGNMRREEEMNKFRCNKCDEFFKCKKSLDRHSKWKHEVNKLMCNDCGKILSRPDAMKRHKTTHHFHNIQFPQQYSIKSIHNMSFL